MTGYSLVLVWCWPSFGSAQQKTGSNTIEDKRERDKMKERIAGYRINTEKKWGKPKVN